MQNNPNQNIHTDYQIDDVFKPEAANQLARAIHYDFVITQKMFDKFVEQHPADTYIDIGRVICSNPDGTDGQTSGVILAKAPISIFIEADTGRKPLEFTYVLTSIIDCSDFKVDGQWDAFVTKDMMNIYSAHPYIVQNIAGGYNFWSTPTAYIETAGGITNNGIAKIGSYKLTQSTNVVRPDNFQLVIEGLGLGVAFTYTASDAAPDETFGSMRPSVVYGNWMTGSGVSTQYSVRGQGTSSPTTIKNGLYAQMQASVGDWDTEPILVVSNNQSTSRYQLSGWNSSAFMFSNVAEGKTVTIYKDGTVEWEGSASTGGGGSAESIIISDFDISALTNPAYPDEHTYQTEPLNSMITYGWNNLRIKRPGYNSFRTIQQETNNPDARFYGVFRGGLFNFESSNTVDWFTWGAISVLNTKPNPNVVEWIPNTKNQLQISFNDLKDGVVYEVRIHLMQLVAAEYTIDSLSGAPIAMQQGIPGESVTRPTAQLSQFSIAFYDKNSLTSQGVVCFWGSSARTVAGWNSGVYVRFHKHSNVIKPTASSIYSSNLQELAKATVRFVRLSGRIYIMEY